MLLYEFLQYILIPLGLNYMIIEPQALLSVFSSFTWENWGAILSPAVLVSSIVYISITWAFFFIMFVVPFRFLCKIINVPKKDVCK